ncbi:MAG: hypothetical protein IKW74_07425, partial [Thermoguttaceae bacterium]|nr:hypothetical protein [Thermoguttaceae bacterium]
LVLGLCALGTGVRAQESDVPTWDENATAESLGLNPIQFPEDFYPLYPWDQSGWAKNYQPITEAIKGMGECDFTLSCFVSADQVDMCEENGMKCIVTLELNREELREPDREKIEEYIKNGVESTKDNPNVIGYFLIDEPGAYFFPGLAVAVEAVQKYAPGKLAYINLFPGYASTIGADAESQLGTHSFREYLERFVQEVKPQFLSYDNYQVEYTGDMKAPGGASYFNDLLEVRRVALKYNLPFWNIVSSLCIMENSSAPHPARFAYQSYTSLAAGVNGLGWFLYYPLGWAYSPIDKNGEKTIQWHYLQNLNLQVRNLGVILNKYKSTQVYFTEPAPYEGLPTEPGTVIKNLSLQFTSRGNIEDTPQAMVGEFDSLQNTGDKAVMIVNLNFAQPLLVKFDLVSESGTLEVVNAATGTANAVEEAGNGFWILPGHGTLFLVKEK